MLLASQSTWNITSVSNNNNALNDSTELSAVDALFNTDIKDMQKPEDLST